MKGKWMVKDEFETEIMEVLLNNFGEYTTVEKVCRYFNIHRNTVYSALDEGKICSLKLPGKHLIVTRSLIPLSRR